jgi:glutathione peroxidase-family protein
MHCLRLLAILVVVALVASAQVSTITHPAPEFPHDGDWLDQGDPVPHSVKGYRGHVLLIDFWEYTCINCIRDFAVVKRWYSKYHSYGFDVLGVHYGEFAIGHSTDNVRRAARRLRLPWSIVSDVNGSFWKAYASNVWPNRYLIDQDGEIVLQVEGEGNNRLMEEKIRDLLAQTRPLVKGVALDREDDVFSPQCGIPTQETYVGHWHGRGALENREGYQVGRVVKFRGSGMPGDGGVLLSGKWRTETDSVTSQARAGRATLRYHARSVYAVLSLQPGIKRLRLYVSQDGKPLDRDNAGADVRFDDKGSYVDIEEPRMFYLVRNPNFGSHTLALAPEAAGFILHSFTYGNNCQQGFEEL